MTLRPRLALAAAAALLAAFLLAGVPGRALAAPVPPQDLERAFDPFDAALWRGFDWARVDGLPGWEDAPGEVFRPGEISYSAVIALHVARTRFLGRPANLTLDRTKWPSDERRIGVSLIGAEEGDCAEAFRRLQAAYGAPAAARGFETRSQSLNRTETDRQWTAGATVLTLECVTWRTGTPAQPGWRVVRVIMEPAAIAWPLVPRLALTCEGGAPLEVVLDEREALASTPDDRMLGLARFSPGRVVFEVLDLRSGQVITYDLDRATGAFTASAPRGAPFSGHCRPAAGGPGAI